VNAATSAPTATAAQPAATTRRVTRWAVLLLAGMREARWLARSPLVLAGLAVSAWLVWLNNRVQAGPGPQPAGIFWWAADVRLVGCMLTAAGGVLIAAHLAAGRAHRDGMAQLYASYPTSAGLRRGALLLSVTGPVVLGIVFLAAAVAWVDSHQALGQPRLWVLGAGLLLVALAGALGTAVASWLRHPMASILLVLVLGLVEIDLVLTYTDPVHLSGGTEWLFPWADAGGVLTALPGLTVPYPPPAHLAELAGLIALAVVAALWPVLAGRRALAAVAVAALAVTSGSAWSQIRAVPAQALAAMAREVMQPASVQDCQLVRGVRYCYYPAFAPLVRQWTLPVDGVLARVPAVTRRGLTVRQVWDADFLEPPLLSPAGLTSNGPAAPTKLGIALAKFQAALSSDPRLVAGIGRPPVYTDANWGIGRSLGAAQLALAVSTAEWVTGLPTTGRSVSFNVAIRGGGSENGTSLVTCVPVDQARQSIALWLAAGATAATRTAFLSAEAPGATQVGKSWIPTVQEPGSGPSAGLLATAQGVTLAREMLRLPSRRVEAILGARWTYWLRPQATAAELAAALGVPLPRQHAAKPQLPYTVGNTTYGNYNPPSTPCP
jgi:hypothetical protein